MDSIFKHCYSAVCIGLLFFLISMDCNAQLRLSNIFKDHIILQRDRQVNVWGWAKPGVTVAVKLDLETFHTTAKADSSWTVKLPAHKAGGPHKMIIKAAAEEIELKDLYFGDLWFCSGQSNMSFQVSQADNYEAELKDADYPLIRELGLTLESTLYPKSDIKETSWKKANKATIGKFSAVAWFFAKELYNKTKVPIGIIHSSWGGTPIEAFMDAKSLENFPSAKNKVDLLSPEFIDATLLKNKQLIEASGKPNPKGFVNLRKDGS